MVEICSVSVVESYRECGECRLVKVSMQGNDKGRLNKEENFHIVYLSDLWGAAHLLWLHRGLPSTCVIRNTLYCSQDHGLSDCQFSDLTF